MSRNKRLLPVLLLSLLLAGCAGKTPPAETLPQVLKTPGTVERTTVTVELGTFSADTLSGNADSRGYVRQSQRLTWEASGSTVKEILVKKGPVKAGDVLMTFQAAQHKADLEELRLQVQSKNDNLETGKQERETAIAAIKSDLEVLSGHEATLAAQELEKLQAEYEKFLYSSRLELDSFNERIGELKENASQETLVAPCDGTVTSVASLSAGDTVAPGTVIYELVGAELPYRELSNALPAGAAVYFSDPETAKTYESYRAMVEAEDYLYVGSVVSAANVLPSGFSLNSWTAVQGDDPMPSLAKMHWFYPGLTVHNALLVPEKALQQEGDQYYVQVLEDGVIRKRFVTVGKFSRQAGRTVWLLDGVSAGQTLVLPEGVK